MADVGSMPSTSARRHYGSDSYWEERYSGSRTEANCTDEWLLSWAQLDPLLAVPKDAQVLDIGCGTSSLAYDMLRASSRAARVVAIDNSASAIKRQKVEQKRRIAHGEASASRIDFICVDACLDTPTAASSKLFDVVIDKSTTDGLLCDTKRGADRVRQIYANVASSLNPSGAQIAVISWRDPSDGVEFLLDCVLGPLKQHRPQGQGAREEVEGSSGSDDARVSWSLDVHSIVRQNADGGEASSGPHVYLLRRRSLRRSKRRRESTDEEDDEEDVVMRHHIHEMDDEG